MLPNYCQPQDIEKRITFGQKALFFSQEKIPLGLVPTVDEDWCAIVQLYRDGDVVVVAPVIEVRLAKEHYDEFNENLERVCGNWSILFVDLKATNIRCPRRHKPQKENLTVNTVKGGSDESGKQTRVSSE